MSKFEDFSRLHVPGEPVVLFNAWDAGSAQAVAKSGAKAIATGSASVSMANGFGDGQQVPLDWALANAARIVESVELPVTVPSRTVDGPASPRRAGAVRAVAGVQPRNGVMKS